MAGSKGGLKGFLDRIDTAVDSALNRQFDPLKPVSASEETRKVGRLAQLRLRSAKAQAGVAAKKLSKVEKRGRKYFIDLALMEGRKSPAERIVRHPKLVIAACVLTSLILSLPAVVIFGSEPLGIDSAMRADLEVFLPPDDPATQILRDIRGNYSTDVMIGLFDLYVPGANITELSWMKQISHFEGDMEAVDSENQPLGVNWRLDDVGMIDGINWTLSVPTAIKIAATTESRFARAVGIPSSVVPTETYAIPNDQGYIDNLVESMDPAQRASLITVRSGDNATPYDRLVVIFGLARDIKQQERALDRAAGLARELNAQNGGNLLVRLTGPVVVFRDLQGGVSQELTKAMPFIIGGLLGVLYFWHRNWRVLVMCLVPVLLASGIAYGSVGLAHMIAPQAVVLAPQIVLAAPMLLATGVSFSLYIVNRFVEEKGDSRAERAVGAVVRINPAIFLSAVAAGIGFFALMIGTLPPIWSLGLALTIGIAFTYIFIYAMVPSFLVLLKYEKKIAFKDWTRVSKMGIRHKSMVIGVCTLFVAASLVVLFSGRVSLDVDYLTMTPANTPSVDAMRDYSNTMGGGQMGIVLAKGNMQAIGSLDSLERVQSGLDGVAHVQTISIVTIMKLVKSPDSITFGGQTISLGTGLSLWDLLHSAVVPASIKPQILSIFYGSIPVETRSMLVNQDLSSGVIYILMPFLSVEETRAAVTAVNDVIDNEAQGGPLTIVHMAGVQTVTLAVNDLIIEGQIISLIVALFLTFIHIWLVFGDLRVAILTMIPVSVVSTLEPLMLWGMGIPLSTVTVMIGSIAIGTGVDFAVQLTQRMRLEGYTMASIENGVEKAGVSFVEATSTMVAGFGGMLAMNISSIQQFVVMIVILLTLNMVMALFLFPALGSIWVRRRKRAPPAEGLYVQWMKSIRDAAEESKHGPPLPPAPHVPSVPSAVDASGE